MAQASGGERSERRSRATVLPALPPVVAFGPGSERPHPDDDDTQGEKRQQEHAQRALGPTQGVDDDGSPPDPCTSHLKPAPWPLVPSTSSPA